MPQIAIDTAASITPLIPAVAGLRPYLTEYDLQGDTADNVVTFENASDNSDICVVKVSSGGGGASWQEQAATKGGQEGIAVNLTLASATRVVGFVSYTYR